MGPINRIDNSCTDFLSVAGVLKKKICLLLGNAKKNNFGFIITTVTLKNIFYQFIITIKSTCLLSKHNIKRDL